MGKSSKEDKILMKKRWGENIRQCFIFSVAVRIYSRSSYLLSFIDVLA